MALTQLEKNLSDLNKSTHALEKELKEITGTNSRDNLDAILFEKEQALILTRNKIASDIKTSNN